MIRRFMLLALLFCLLGAVGASAAAGSAFYNESESGQPDPLIVYFDCGIFCGNTWDIPVGGWDARPGKGGSFVSGNIEGWPKPTGDTGWTNSTYIQQCETPESDLRVSDHGWVELHYQGSGAYEWRVYDDNGAAVPGSPFALIFESCAGPPIGRSSG